LVLVVCYEELASWLARVSLWLSNLGPSEDIVIGKCDASPFTRLEI
jgi:hypothetical protein